MNVIIFGDRELAELAHYYLTQKAHRNVVAFCVNGAHLKQTTLFDLPVIPFEDIARVLPPEENEFFAPVYAKQMNQLREEVANKIKRAGYRLISFVDPSSMLHNSSVGENCFIFENVNVQPFCKIGNNVIIWSCTHIGHHSEICDNNFISTHVAVSGRCRVEPYCFLGTSSVTRDGLTLARGTMLGIGAALAQDTEPWSLYLGVPAKQVPDRNTLEIMK